MTCSSLRCLTDCAISTCMHVWWCSVVVQRMATMSCNMHAFTMPCRAICALHMSRNANLQTVQEVLVGSTLLGATFRVRGLLHIKSD